MDNIDIQEHIQEYTQEHDHEHGHHVQVQVVQVQQQHNNVQQQQQQQNIPISMEIHHQNISYIPCENQSISTPTQTSTTNKIDEIPGKQRRKHVVLTISQKQEVVQAVLDGARPADICQKFNLPRSTLFDLVKRRQRLLVFGTDGKINNDQGNRKTMHGARHRKLDYALLKWYNKRTNEGYLVTGPIIKEKAKQFHQELGNSTPCKFTAGWLDKFKHRHGLRFQKSKKEKLTLHQDAESIHHFIDDYEDFKEEFMNDIERTMIDIKQEPFEDDDDHVETEANTKTEQKVINTPSHGKITIKSSRKQLTRLKMAIKTLMKHDTDSEIFGKNVASQLKYLPADLSAAAKSSIQEYITQVKVQESSTNFHAPQYVYIDQSQTTDNMHHTEIVTQESPVTIQSQDLATITYQAVAQQALQQPILNNHIPHNRIKQIDLQQVEKTYQTDNNGVTIIHQGLPNERIHVNKVEIQNHQLDKSTNFQIELRGNPLTIQPLIQNVEIPSNQIHLESLQSVIRSNILDINSSHGTIQNNTDLRNHQLNIPTIDLRTMYMDLHRRY